MSTDGEVQGLQDMFRALDRLGARVGVKVIRSALRASLKSTVADARSLAPRGGDVDGDGYTLAPSIRIQAENSRTRKRDESLVSLRIGAARRTADGRGTSSYAIKGGLGPSAKAPNYAQLVNKDKPFLVPALERNEDQIVRRFAAEVRRGIERL